MNCMYEAGDDNPHCWAVPENRTTRFYVKQYGFVSGEIAMMNEIYQHGPITCGMTTPDEFAYGYHGGVWTDKTGDQDSDHLVEVVGWGEEHGQKYWKIRNSWGSYWGENGWFKLRRGINNMRIEEQCAAAIVDVHELDDVLSGAKVGSMFGLVGRDEEPQQLPDNWKRMKPHKWNPNRKAAKAREQEVHDFIHGEALARKNKRSDGAPADEEPFSQADSEPDSTPEQSKQSKADQAKTQAEQAKQSQSLVAPASVDGVQAGNSLLVAAFALLSLLVFALAVVAMFRYQKQVGYSSL